MSSQLKQSERNKSEICILIYPSDIIEHIPPSGDDQRDKESQNESQRYEVCVLVAEVGHVFEDTTKRKLV